MEINNDNKHFLVTGGTRGIGKAIVAQLLDSGASVSFTYNKGKEEAENILKELSSKYPAKVYAYHADIKDEVKSQILVEQVQRSTLGPLQGLINNAGITMDSSFFRMSTDMWKEVISTNLDGTYFMSKAVIKLLIRQQSTKIINISSVSGIKGAIGQANYGVAKAGIISLTKTMALEFAKFNININAVAPGYIDTDMVAAIGDPDRKKINSMIPMKRMGTAKEVSDLVVFLASDKSNYITGQTFVIDGGLTL